MKTGQMGKILAWIIGMMSLLLLIFFLVNVIKTAQLIEEDSECKNQIMLHVASQKTTGGDVSTEITCPTKYYTVKTKSEEDVKRSLAESLKSCWGTWGKGELQLFSKDNTYCTVCSVVDFENKDMKVSGFTEYLASEKPLGSKDSQTYARYLKFYSTEESDEEFLDKLSDSSIQKIEIDTSKKYATVFLYAKGSNQMKEIIQILTPETPVGGAKEGMALGAIVGVGVAYGAAALGVISGPVGWMTLVGAGTIAGGAGGALMGLDAGNSPDYISSPLLIEFTPDSFQKLGCKTASVAQDNQKDKLG